MTGRSPFADEPGDMAFLSLERQPAGLASDIHPGGNPVERIADDLDVPSLLSLFSRERPPARNLGWFGASSRGTAAHRDDEVIE
jgi:hypothetical protein